MYSQHKINLISIISSRHLISNHYISYRYVKPIQVFTKFVHGIYKDLYIQKEKEK